jgi:hypothetical protein
MVDCYLSSRQKKKCGIHHNIYYSVIKNENLQFPAKWRELKDVMLRDMSNIERQLSNVLSYMEILKKN